MALYKFAIKIIFNLQIFSNHQINLGTNQTMAKDIDL